MKKEEFLFRNPDIRARELDVFSIRQAPFSVHGLYHPEEPGIFRRMPKEAAEKVSPNVLRLSTNTAGGRIRFRTDSDYIGVGAIYPKMDFVSPNSACLSNAGAFCFDLYADGHFETVLHPKETELDGRMPRFLLVHEEEPGQRSGDCRFESGRQLEGRRMRDITICMPNFFDVREVYIGLVKGSRLEACDPYPNEKPVVFYGSSITQGACASRPGNTYQNVLSRRLNFDYINLGFSGNAKAEPAIIDYLCSLDMKVLVFDYDHNASSPEKLRESHYPALVKLRKEKPDLPIILMSRPNHCAGIEQVKQRIAVIEESLAKFQERGERKMHFVSGQDIFYSYDRDMMTLDDTHPTDFGFFCMAEALQGVLELYLKQNSNEK